MYYIQYKNSMIVLICVCPPPWENQFYRNIFAGPMETGEKLKRRNGFFQTKYRRKDVKISENTEG
jgi:hypothetical protein